MGAFVPASATAQATGWPAQLQAARTPNALTQLATAWFADVHVAAQEAQGNELNAQVSDFGGVGGLITAAQAALTTAQNDNLDPGQLQALVAAVRDALRSGANATQQVDQLLAAVKSEKALIALNDSVDSGVRPLMLVVDQAAAESTPSGNAYLSEYDAVVAAFHNATTTAQLTAVQQQISSLQASVNTELGSNQCGHNVGSGKVITVNLIGSSRRRSFGFVTSARPIASICCSPPESEPAS